MWQLNYFHFQLTPSEVQGSLKKLGQTMNKQFRKKKKIRDASKKKRGFFDCKVKILFLLLHQNIQMSGHLILLHSTSLPQQEQDPRKTSDSAQPPVRKLGVLSQSWGKEIPHFGCFPASLTRKKLLVIPPCECLFQLVDCARTKEFLPFSWQNIQKQQSEESCGAVSQQQVMNPQQKHLLNMPHIMGKLLHLVQSAGLFLALSSTQTQHPTIVSKAILNSVVCIPL